MKDSDQIRSGFKNMSRSRAVVCGLARDCSRTLPHLIQKLEQLGACFSDCRYIVVENDSRDPLTCSTTGPYATGPST